ncbi:MAG TPA: M56 family metallopeptidase, partial [Streptosporangiaceae bacterium]|nr:M56 family metallopeptidase [Streptosporangiaceae bacterium]
WPARSPRAALVLWQAIGLGGGLAILGAGVTLAVSGLHRSWLAGVAALPDAVLGGSGVPGPGLLGWAGVALTLVAGVWLATVAAVSTARLLRVRREHRQRIDLLAEEVPAAELAAARPAGPGGVPAGRTQVRLVNHPLVAAYCLPGVRPRIVLSQGAIDALAPDQLTAVVMHEHAHARGQHHLVIQPFRAWQQTFPFLPAARRATAAVELLVEVTADDVARRHCGPAPLAAALAALTEPGDEQIAARMARLGAAPRPLPRLAAAAVCAAAIVLVALPPVILLAS